MIEIEKDTQIRPGCRTGSVPGLVSDDMGLHFVAPENTTRNRSWKLILLTQSFITWKFCVPLPYPKLTNSRMIPMHDSVQCLNAQTTRTI
jgi:hypothetical protein